MRRIVVFRKRRTYTLWRYGSRYVELEVTLVRPLAEYRGETIILLDVLMISDLSMGESTQRHAVRAQTTTRGQGNRAEI